MATDDLEERRRLQQTRRRLTRQLGDQLVSTATWLGTLADLAEAGDEVTCVVGSRAIRGCLRAVGVEVVVLDGNDGDRYYLRPRSLAAVSTATPRPATGDRQPTLRTSFAAALALLVETRAPVQVHLRGHPTSFAGHLVAIGNDILTLDSGLPREPTMLIYTESVDLVVAFNSADK